MKHRLSIFAVVGTVLLALLIGMELVFVSRWDGKLEEQRQEMVENIMKNALDASSLVPYDEDAYSNVVGRELTADEINNQKELAIKFHAIIYSNTSIIEDVILPDGTWMLDEDAMCVKVMNGDGYIFELDNAEILDTYRSYTADSYYHYDKKELVEQYKYYTLVFDSFYVDGTQLLPEQVSIYEIKCNLDKNMPKDELSVALKETMEFSCDTTPEMDYYELAEEDIDFTVGKIYCDYVCNGETDCRVIEAVLDEKYQSLAERKQLLENSLQEKPDAQKDLLGISKYYYADGSYYSDYYEDYVTLVGCETNFYHEAYKSLTLWIVLVLAADVLLAYGFATVVFLKKDTKKSNPEE